MPPGDLKSVEETRKAILDAVRPLPAEQVPAADALGRVLAEDLESPYELPPFDSSAMDGFAVVAGGAGELAVIGESRAGAPYTGSIGESQAVRISTGAVIPAGATAVVPIERASDLGERVRVPDCPEGSNVRRAGEDVGRGQTVLRAGCELGPAELGILAAFGRVAASCRRRPRVALVATGDELLPPGRPLGPGQIHDSNAASIAALATRAGAEVGLRVTADDDRARTVDALRQAAEHADVVCISGGVSVGPHDHVKPALEAIGFAERIWGVRLKPGKPFWFGTRDGQYAFGLPGNPVSAMVTFTLFVHPALRALQGAGATATRSTAILDGPIAANADRDQAIRCRLRVADDGWHAEPTGPQGSHVLSSMIGADALAIVPAGERDLEPGERVTVEVL